MAWKVPRQAKPLPSWIQPATRRSWWSGPRPPQPSPGSRHQPRLAPRSRWLTPAQPLESPSHQHAVKPVLGNPEKLVIWTTTTTTTTITWFSSSTTSGTTLTVAYSCTAAGISFPPVCGWNTPTSVIYHSLTNPLPFLYHSCHVVNPVLYHFCHVVKPSQYHSSHVFILEQILLYMIIVTILQWSLTTLSTLLNVSQNPCYQILYQFKYVLKSY